MDAWALIAERRILEAIDRGEFDNLPGRFKPLPEEDLSGVDPESRLGMKILKNSGVLPPEMQLRKEIALLKSQVEACRDPVQKAVFERDLAAKTLSCDVMMDGRRSQRGLK